jgi:hypothetical protein
MYVKHYWNSLKRFLTTKSIIQYVEGVWGEKGVGWSSQTQAPTGADIERILNWIELNFIQNTIDMYKLKTKYTIIKYPVNYIGYAL